VVLIKKRTRTAVKVTHTGKHARTHTAYGTHKRTHAHTQQLVILLCERDNMRALTKKNVCVSFPENAISSGKMHCARFRRRRV